MNAKMEKFAILIFLGSLISLFIYNILLFAAKINHIAQAML